MKYLYLQDTHIKGVNPISRTGNYYKDMMSKMKDIIRLSKAYEVDGVIHGGDLFDSANVSNTLIDDLLDMIEEAKIKWYILPGNHDQIGHNWDLSKSSSLAHIFRRSWLVEELKILKGDDWIIEGFVHKHNFEAVIKENGLTCSHPNKSWKIGIIHALVTKKPFLPQVMHVAIEDIDTDFDNVLVGHNHYPWQVIRNGGTQFINYGCIGRTGIDEADIKPTILHINTDTQKIQPIELASAKSKEEIFDLTKMAKSKEFQRNIDHFIKSLDSTKFQALDLKGLVEHLAKENGTDKEVKDEVINRIGDCEND